MDVQLQTVTIRDSYILSMTVDEWDAFWALICSRNCWKEVCDNSIELKKQDEILAKMVDQVHEQKRGCDHV